jgi:hypothetical protein
MPGFLVTKPAVVTCTHLGPVQVVPTQMRVLATGMPVITAAAQLAVTGCPFPAPATPPHPCVLVKWLNVSARVTVMGQPALLQASPAGTGDGIAQAVDLAPQGPPILGVVQTRAVGT